METKTILVCRVFVGALPKKRADGHINEFKNTFLNGVSLPEHVKCIFIADYNDSSFEVINIGNSDVNIEELENMIGDEKEQLINLRLSKVEKSIVLQKSKKYGFKNLSEYLRFVGLNANIEVNGKEK